MRIDVGRHGPDHGGEATQRPGVVEDFEVVAEWGMPHGAELLRRGPRFASPHLRGLRRTPRRAAKIPGRQIQVVELPIPGAEEQQRSPHHELDVVGVSGDR